MPKKKINPNSDHGFLGEGPKYKAKPKPYVQRQNITDYITARDRLHWKMYPELREELEEKYKNLKK